MMNNTMASQFPKFLVDLPLISCRFSQVSTSFCTNTSSRLACCRLCKGFPWLSEPWGLASRRAQKATVFGFIHHIESMSLFFSLDLVFCWNNTAIMILVDFLIWVALMWVILQSSQVISDLQHCDETDGRSELVRYHSYRCFRRGCASQMLFY